MNGIGFFVFLLAGGAALVWSTHSIAAGKSGADAGMSFGFWSPATTRSVSIWKASHAAVLRAVWICAIAGVALGGLAAVLYPNVPVWDNELDLAAAGTFTLGYLGCWVAANIVAHREAIRVGIVRARWVRGPALVIDAAGGVARVSPRSLFRQAKDSATADVIFAAGRIGGEWRELVFHQFLGVSDFDGALDFHAPRLEVRSRPIHEPGQLEILKSYKNRTSPEPLGPERTSFFGRWVDISCAELRVRLLVDHDDDERLRQLDVAQKAGVARASVRSGSEDDAIEFYLGLACRPRIWSATSSWHVDTEEPSSGGEAQGVHADQV